jgi:arginyl-tRNA synthetase
MVEEASESPPAPEQVDPWSSVRLHLADAVHRALQKEGFSGALAEVERNLGEPPEGKGDLALPTFRWAKALRTTPPALAQQLATAIPPVPGFARIHADGGFLNAELEAVPFLLATLEMIARRGARYGSWPPTGPGILLEHTSANPTGALHVGRSRNGVIGDTYARVLRARGYPVTTEFYVDDLGRQAATLVWVWSLPPARWPEEIRQALPAVTSSEPPPGVKPDHYYGQAYVPAFTYMRTHPEVEAEVNALATQVEQGVGDLAAYRRVPAAILEGILASLARMNVRFDRFVWESDLVVDGSVQRVLERLAASAKAHRAEDGALGVDGRPFGLPEESPFVYATRADGTHLYPARDVAYHLGKFRRAQRVINVLGQDHRLHVQGLFALLDAVGEERRPETLFYGYVNLPEGKMTTRGGRVVLLDQVLDEGRQRARAELEARRPELSKEEREEIAERIGHSAVRYHLLRVQPDKPIVFRWEEALSFEGKSAPFLQYAHARASSLLRKAGETGPDPAALPVPSLAEVPSVWDPRETALVRSLSRLPGLVDRVAVDGAVHLLAVYGHDLSERFNEFYQSLRVLDADGPVRSLRLALVRCTRQVLANTLDLLGLEALERM